MKLRTSHGTHVFVGEYGALLHLLETPDQDFESVWNCAPPPFLGPGLTEAAITEGPLAPSTLILLEDGLVAFRRNHLFLCADPTLSELRFDRPQVGAWECFAIENRDGETVHYALPEPIAHPPSVSRPVLIETQAGYHIMTEAADAKLVTVKWPDFWKDVINRFAMPDGSWIVDVDGTQDPDRPFLVYWFYPFSAKIHVWGLDRSGRRVVAYDLSSAKARSFLLGRRVLGPALTARLYMLSHDSRDAKALELLNSELYAAAEAGSAEALFAVLCRPMDLPTLAIRGLAARAFNLMRAANRTINDDGEAHLNRVTAEAMSRALSGLDPKLNCLSQEQLQAEIDFRDVFGDPKQFPSGATVLPGTLHCHNGLNLASVLGAGTTYLTIGILLRAATKTVEFHYAHSTSVRHRIMDGLRYAYYALCTSPADVWEHLASLNDAAQAWMIRFDVGDLPSEYRPSVSFERLVGDEGVSLVPDSYYFCFRGFRSGWFAGDVPPWSQKATRFVWRGSTTGAGDLTRETLAKAHRFRLCELGKAIGPVADFAITDVVQAEPHAADIKTILRDRDMLRERMPQHIMGGNKYLIEIDGNANSWGFFAKLLMGCCVLKVDSPFEQWFYERLQPWVHYVPVSHDLSDLLDRVDWCLKHQGACRKIADAGRRLADSMNFDQEMSAVSKVFLSAVSAYE